MIGVHSLLYAIDHIHSNSSYPDALYPGTSVYRAPLTRGNAHARIQLRSLARAIDGRAVHWAHANSPIEAQEICSYSWKEDGDRA